MAWTAVGLAKVSVTIMVVYDCGLRMKSLAFTCINADIPPPGDGGS